MEIIVPVAALAGMYFLNKTASNPAQESFESNVNIPDANYPVSLNSLENTDIDDPEQTTSALSTGNRFVGNGAYTDKYFDPDPKTKFARRTPYDPNAPNVSVGTKYDSMIGKKVEGSYFHHNNMVPFFGAKQRTLHREPKDNEGILDNYSGTGTQIINKKEVSPLFSPHESLNYAYGAPNQNDFMQSRVNPSQKMSNVKPFGEIKVAPGLGLGYTAEGAGGYNSGMAMREQWVDRNVDELRVKTNPKASGYGLYGHEGPAISFVQERGDQGLQEKNRVETAYAMGADRLLTTTGAVQGNMQIPTHIQREVARPETSHEYAGGAKLAQQTGSTHYVVGEYHDPHGIELGSYPLRPAVAQGKYVATDGDYAMKSNQAYLNNRSVGAGQDDYFGAVRGALTEAVAPLMDVLRPSRKENSTGTLRPYENPKSAVPLTYVYNPHDKTKTTLREITQDSLNHLNVSANQRGGAYETTPHQPVENARYKTSDYYYAGNASAGEGTKQTRPVDAEYNQRNNNKKASTNVGYTTGGNIGVFNPNVRVDVATKRDDVLKNKRGVVPSLTSVGGPDMDRMGTMSTKGSTQLYPAQQLDRNDGSTLKSLKENPYAIRMNRAL